MIFNHTNGGGIDINGVIKQYQVYAGNSISAGDFVHYLKDNYISNSLLTSSVGLFGTIDCVQLDSSRVFISFAITDGSNWISYGVVVTISGITMTAGTLTALNNVVVGIHNSVVALSDSRVLIMNGLYTSSGIVLSLYSVIGSTITQLSYTTPYSSFYAGEAKLVALNSTTVFMAFRASSSSTTYPLAGVVITITGSVITLGDYYVLSSVTGSAWTIRCKKLSSTSVLIVHSYSSNDVMYAMAASISGSTITVGSDYSVGSDLNSGQGAVALLTSTKVVTSWHYSGKYYARVLSISGTTISQGTLTLLGNLGASAGAVQGARLTDSSAIFWFKTIIDSVTYLTYSVVEVDELSSTSNGVYKYSSSLTGYSYHCCVELNTNRVLIFFEIGATLYDSDTSSAGNFVELATTATNGIAAGDGVAGDTIDVYIPAYAAT